MPRKMLYENKDFTIEMDGEILINRYKKGVIINKNVSSQAIKKDLSIQPI